MKPEAANDACRRRQKVPVEIPSRATQATERPSFACRLAGKRDVGCVMPAAPGVFANHR
jgi:hypothetical protein